MDDCTVSTSKALKNAMKLHLKAQNCMSVFNSAFAPFLLIFVVQIFIMCCALFFVLAKQPMNNPVDVIVFLGNGTQYLLRALVFLFIVGKVGGKFELQKLLITRTKDRSTLNPPNVLGKN